VGRYDHLYENAARVDIFYQLTYLARFSMANKCSCVLCGDVFDPTDFVLGSHKYTIAFPAINNNGNPDLALSLYGGWADKMPMDFYYGGIRFFCESCLEEIVEEMFKASEVADKINNLCFFINVRMLIVGRGKHYLLLSFNGTVAIPIPVAPLGMEVTCFWYSTSILTVLII
jgi:hypothetical protein